MKLAALLIGSLLALAACGGRAQQDAATNASAGTVGADSADAGTHVDAGPRVPKNHRPSATACPTGRGTGNSPPLSPDCPLDGGLVDCVSDTDCSGGKNGRCFPDHFHCSTGCQYDDCFTDSDCSGNAPCDCRASASDADQNFCVTGSGCRVDADCGDNGYCSPSLVYAFCECDNCEHGYFCHTPSDTCVDDSDCDKSGTCNYDQLAQRWQCDYCLPIP
jgi:hypothetical protein